MDLYILQLITLFSAFLLFILGFIFILKPIKKLSNLLLGGFLISNAVLLANFFFFISSKQYPANYPVIHIIGTQSYMLLAPLLYLYIKSLCTYNYQLSPIALFHLAPFAVIVCLGFCIYLFKTSLETYFPDTGFFYYLIFKPVLYIQIAAYVFASFSALRKYRLQLKELYSNLVKIDLQWINIVLYFLILMSSTDLAIYTAINLDLKGFIVFPWLTYQTISINLILCICLIYKGMGQSEFSVGKFPLPKYVQNNTDISNYEEYKKKLTRLMTDEKPFLLPELSLDELAKKMDITPRLLSQIIHVCFNQNFNNYINHYRVEEAKKLFAKDKEFKKSIFEILLDSGFNSKSVFNYSFKKTTGVTPKEFRYKINIKS